MVALAGEGQAPAAVPEDRIAHGDGRTASGMVGVLLGVQSLALFHMQLDEIPDTSQRDLVAAHPCRVQAVGGGHLGEGVSLRITQVQRLGRIDGAGEQARSQASHPEAGPFLLGEDRQRQCPVAYQGACRFAFGEQVVGGQRTGNPQWPVEGPAAGHRVQV